MNSAAHVAGQGARLRGRDSECATLDSVIAAVRQGQSRTLVLTGEAGVGKTALLSYLVDSARDLHVIRAAGVESEMELAYASLHQLCAPMLDRMDRLPDPQREALGIVFGRSGGPPGDVFLVGLAVLSLLSEVAEDRPLLCVVDDAQWLDRSSARTLAFVARRLVAEPVGFVFAMRDPSEELRALPELEVTGLRDGDARALLSSAAQFLPDSNVRDRIVAETRGNPLALLELPRGLTATELAGGFGLLEPRALSGRIEQSFERRLEALPENTRMLLLVAAAEPVGDPLLLWQAADRLGIGAVSLAADQTDGLLSIRERVTFRHPLVRSAVYRAAWADQRRAAHLALAEVTDPQVDPDRRAWHLASAAAGPDEAVALELERSAERAQARGGLAAAAAFLERSVALSDDPVRRTERALSAAEAGLNAGAYESAVSMLTVAEAGSLDELGRGRLELLHGMAAYAQRRGSDAPPLLLRAAKTLEPLDPKLARDTYLDAWCAALFAGSLAPTGSLYDVSREVRQAGVLSEPRACDLVLDGFARLLTDGRAAATPPLQQAVRAFAGDGVTPEEVLRWGWLATMGAHVVWDYERCVAIGRRSVQAARDAGALTVLAVGLHILSEAVTMGGEFELAERLIAEANTVTEATGTRVLQYGPLFLRAWQGRKADVARLYEITVREATAGGQGTAIEFADLARAVVFNALGLYHEALAPAQAAADATPEMTVALWALPEVVEAAARSGEPEVAERALERYAERNHPIANDWGLGLEARLRALLAKGSDAEAFYLEAIERLGRTQLRIELARAQLLYGEWLRREDRRSDARVHLRAAYDLLSAIGMAGFAERARVELLGVGERVRERSAAARDDLTAQERQVAQLARDGLSNAEIGARLFLSPRTVEWHLGKVFSKLGIRSRHELASVLSGLDSEPAPL